MATVIAVIISSTLSAAIVGAVAYLIIKKFVENEQKKSLLELKKIQESEILKVVNPIRLQAYERLALFLERISPNSLVLRCYQPGMDIKLLQGVMTKNIRDEWEHNLSQQVYVSSTLWTRIREAKDEMINLVNSSAVGLSDTSDPTRLAATIFASAADRSPVDSALEAMHKELNELFG